MTDPRDDPNANDFMSLEEKRAWTARTSDLAMGGAIFGALMLVVLIALSPTPRNFDNSIKAMFLVPTFGGLGVVAALLLQKRLLDARALRFACWFTIIFGCLIVPVAIYDAVTIDKRQAAYEARN